MTPRLKDVAALAGVSVKTVSNVINDYPFVREETRVRVQMAIDKLRYRPNLSARRLRTGRSGLIALSLPEISTPYFGEIAGLIVDVAEQRGWTVLIDQTGGERSHEQRTAAGIRADLIDGSIASPLSMTPADVAALDRSHPVVLLGEQLARVAADHIAIDNVRAARETTEHLISSGCRRIAVIGARPRHNGTANLRLEGYSLALGDAGLRPVRSLVAPASDFHLADGYAAMQALLGTRRPPDAVFCFNDLLAFGALRAVAEAGLAVPGDIKVCGFDDIELCRYSSPTLTSVSPDKRAIAETAVDLLARRITGAETGPGQDIVVPHTLEVRDSTAPAGQRR